MKIKELIKIFFCIPDVEITTKDLIYLSWGYLSIIIMWIAVLNGWLI